MRYTSLLLAMAALLVLVPPLTVSGWGAELAFGLSLAVLCGGALAASEPPHLRSPAVWLLPPCWYARSGRPKCSSQPASPTPSTSPWSRR